MADRAKTGNVLIDAWFDAFAPLMPAENGAAPWSAWEGMFFGNAFGESNPSTAIPYGAAAAAKFAEMWSDVAQRSFAVTAALGTTKNAGDPLGQALEQSFAVLGDVGGTVAEAPALIAQTAKTASALFAAREAYRAFMLATWQRAFGEIAREAARLTSERKPPATPAQWLALSNRVADRVFVAAFHSEAYVAAQARLAAALADQRRTETKFVESFAQFGHFPTRRAVDDLSKEVNELRRRVRALERADRAETSARRGSGER